MLWCAVTIVPANCSHRIDSELYGMPQRNGTAIHSLAGEHLQESESLVGLERQKQEEVIGVAMGSLYQGEALCYSWDRHMTLTWSLFSRLRHRV